MHLHPTMKTIGKPFANGKIDDAMAAVNWFD